MPNIKSAKKRVKVGVKKAGQNKSEISNMKTVLKKADAAIESNAADKDEAVRAAIKTVDKAASKGLIHKKNAAHKKAALASKLKK